MAWNRFLWGLVSLSAGFSPIWAGTVGEGDVPAVAIVVKAPPPDADIVDDFDDGDDHNYWEGVMGPMQEVDGDGSMTRSFESVGAFAGESLKLTYDLTKASNWNGYFVLLHSDVTSSKNLSGYKQLSFWVKGAVGGVEHLKIGLENRSATARNTASLYVNDYLDGGITNAWQKVSIPLDAFANLDTKSNVRVLTFVFEKAYVNPAIHPALAQKATIYIDDIRFSAVSLGSVRIDHFGDNWGWGALGGNSGEGGEVGGTTSHSYSNAAGTYSNFAWSFQSNYSVTLPTSYAYHFIILGGGSNGWTAVPINFSGYRYLKFSARARSAGENPVSFKMELVSNGKKANLIIGGLTTTFQTFTTDLSLIPSADLDRTTLQQINIVYENGRVTNKTGVVFFDDFRLSETP